MVGGFMGETILSEIVQKKGYLVLPFAQERSQINHIEIAVRRGRTSFKTTLEHGEFPVDPQPVFAINCDSRLSQRRNFLYLNIFTEGKPLVGKPWLRILGGYGLILEQSLFDRDEKRLSLIPFLFRSARNDRQN